MPSSPNFFQARSSSYTRRSTALVVCCFIGFTIGFIAISRQRLGYTYKYDKPRSVSVVWEKNGNGNGNRVVSDDGDQKRHKVMGFVGIQTGFGYIGRRRSLRWTWMPSDHQGLQRLEEAIGFVFRFIIGRTRDKAKMSELRKEVVEFDDFMLLDIEEVLAFFKAAYALYDSDFYAKADDDIYLRPDRLSLLLAKERSHTQTHLGCRKKGPVFTDPKLKWYEPLLYFLGKACFWSPIYALSADVVASLVALRNDSFRMFSNEDVTIGAWMLVMNANHEDNQQLCQPECTASSIAVWDIPKCSGLCNPEKKLSELHQKESCTNTPILDFDE